MLDGDAGLLARAGIRPGRLATICGIAAGIATVAPVPEGLSSPAWHLFLIFAATIASVIANGAPIFVASIAALAVSVLSGVLKPEFAYSGFSKGFILLIAMAFLIARGVVKSGLGNRIAYLLISRLGQTTLGLGYAMLVTDLIIAPAFPSNTARSGVLFPVTESLARGSGSNPDAETRKRTGAFLMMMSMTGLSISSALWMTAMAANPTGAEMAASQGVEITFGSWFLAASMPALVAAVVVPRVLFRFFPPEVVTTPDAPQKARDLLSAMGPMSRQEWITAGTFVGLVSLWSMARFLGLDPAAIAFAGLLVLMLSGIFTVKDLKAEGGTLEVLIWFAVLYTISTYLDRFGFMAYLGEIISRVVGGAPWPLVFAALLVGYVLLHLFFVSQTAHLLALFPVFLSVGIGAGVPGALMAYLLLFATNFFSCITPQGSSANVIFVGSGYLTPGEVYRNGMIVTLANLVVFGTVGTAWVLMVM